MHVSVTEATVAVGLWGRWGNCRLVDWCLC
jgi:hypothetical protein